MADNPFGIDLNGLMEQLQTGQGGWGNLAQAIQSKQVEAEAGGGMVKVTANGNMELTAIRIDPKVIDPTDPGMLEDLILMAANRALTEARNQMAQQMAGSLFGGLGG